MNDDGVLVLNDVIFLLSYLFLGAPAPDAASPGCAGDSTPDSLDCVNYGACD